jgi:hypothetical protein
MMAEGAARAAVVKKRRALRLLKAGEKHRIEQRTLSSSRSTNSFSIDLAIDNAHFVSGKSGT